MKVAFQGELGAFSQQAIRQLLGAKAQPGTARSGSTRFLPRSTIGKVDAAAIPIENTLHGSVHENYDLLLKYDFEITAETNVRIVHNLIAPPGLIRQFARCTPIRSRSISAWIFSHAQTHRARAFYDTAGSVKMIMEERPPARRGDRLGAGGENL